MKRTEFIKLAMRDLLIPSEGINNLFPDSLERLRLKKGKRSFFDLQTFPHIGDIVIGSDPVPIPFKVQSITWANNDRVMIAPKNEEGYPITKLYPVCISDEVLLRLGFKWDERFCKFRLRLRSFYNIDIEKTNYPEPGYYIRGVDNIKYLHELQAVLRIYNIDKGILDNRLRIGEGLSKIGLIDKMYE